MSSFIVPLVTVRSVTKHSNADTLDVITFEEVAWTCVDKLGLRKVGDRVIYVPVEAVVKTSRPEFAFLADKAKADGTFRIRTIKLRGQVSQGLIVSPPPFVPYSQLTGLVSPTPGSAYLPTTVETLPLGVDFSDFLEIIKYEPPEENAPPDRAGLFPGWCQKTDAERFQNYNRTIELYQNITYYKTLKMDGTSCTVFYDGDRPERPVGVCSHNYEIKQDDTAADKWFTDKIVGTNQYWAAAINQQLLNKITKIAELLQTKHVAIQGEICGPGIQKNRMNFSSKQFLAFDIFDGEHGGYLDYPQFLSICKQLDIPTVTVLAVETIEKDFPTKFDWVENLKYPNGYPAEGVVFVASPPQAVGSLGRLKFKVLSATYDLKNKE